MGLLDEIKGIVQKAMQRVQDTPSGWKLDFKNTAKEILTGLHTDYQESKPSLSLYLYRDLNWEPITESDHYEIDPSIDNYKVSLGIDTLHIPKEDSVRISRLVGLPIHMNLASVLDESLDIRPSMNRMDSTNYYDAGSHTGKFYVDENGQYRLATYDVYDFDPGYSQRYAGGGF